MLVESDQQLVQIVDAALAEAVRRSGSWLECGPGCSQCCLGPLEITELDALRLIRGLATLDGQHAAVIRSRAAAYRAEAEDAPCPALDLESGRCDLYEFRPITCRVFGPPVAVGDSGIGVCELCYGEATNDQIASCAVHADDDGLEAALLEGLPQRMTTVAEALLR